MTSITSLRGIKVLELGEGWTAALCGKLLADLGGDVTKVEIPGDRLREFGRNQGERDFAFALPNAAKRLVKNEDLPPEAMSQFLRDADVVLINADVAERFKIDLSLAGPQTVVCRFSPFRLDGPLSEQVANDLTLQAISGVMATTGEPGGAPLRIGTEWSSAVGALYGAIGVLAALIERTRSSAGQIVDISLYECLVSTLTNFASRVLGGVKPLGRIGNQGPNSAPWELFKSVDGKDVFIIAGSPPTFQRLCEVMERSDLLEDPRFLTPHKRREHFKEITEVVAAWAATLPRDGIVKLLRDNGVPVSPVCPIGEVLADEHFASRGLLQTIADESGHQWPSAGQPLGYGQSRSFASSGNARSPEHRRTLPTPSGGERTRPLSGIRVIDFGTLTAGPFCTRMFANMGADVLKIEPVEGEAGRHSLPIVDDESVYFHITNSDKRSFSVNLREEGDVALVREVALAADILVENQAPGALTKRGLGSADLCADAPDLVYTSVSGYGHEGVLGGHRAYDSVIQAGAGLMSMTGEEKGKPMKAGISAADVLGSLGAATASLGAVFGRMTGRHRGVRLDVALYDMLAWSMQMSWVTEFSGLGAGRHGNGHWLFAPYGVFETSDEALVAIAAETDEEWRRLAVILAEAMPDRCPPGLESWARTLRWERKELLEELLATYCGACQLDEVVKRLQADRVPAAAVVEVEEVFTTRQAVAPTTADLVLANGKSLRVTDISIRFSATPAEVRMPGPGLGLENDKIRSAPEEAWESVFGAR